MNQRIFFKEDQCFTHWSVWWVWVILFGLDILLLYGVYVQLILGKPFGDKPASDVGLLFATVLLLGITLLFALFRLQTIIKEDGVYVRFYPFHIKMRYFPWSELEKVYVRKYKPITEYGGWGLRIGGVKNGTAYNMSGNKGLQLVFKRGKKLLIGTRKSNELQQVLEQEGFLSSSDKI
ncbi:DUF6141 family protein [Sphingobacterium sp. UT-1RO-CII-1]|uniref:DUF6141 family protein n=1 Tax=Sphingobacterium sp. UT-1RO-CII-1 TaxID=2995225 RepID=UPI00227C9749|nr:DUF6141 family protein [Sphingobacterium sp. UT-1RO-CII-1]MCY4780311.1 DUF6141 family protein [Sphingobacterium sp. UT-1RO-CII-1]